MLPSIASYERALRDITQAGTRISWRGTAAELRETLREVLNHLAPDEQVMASPGFQPEEGQSKPTQKQKVMFILKARGSSSLVINGAVASLTRSTYQTASASTHVGADAKEIKNIKRYIDALLAELLEIS